MSDNQSRLGSYIRCSVTAGETYQAFLPPALPPEPPLDLLPLQGLLSKANQALGKLDAVADILPDSNLLLYYYVRKEAVLSSQIEGTQSSLSDLLLHDPRDAYDPSFQRAGQQQAARRVPHIAKLDWWIAAWQCRLCSAAARAIDGVSGCS